MSETPPDPYGSPNPYGQGGPYGGATPYGGASPYGVPPAADHPQSTTVLVLGILGLVLCQIMAPFAWVMGNRVVREIDASGGAVGGRTTANAGRICGMIGSILLILGLVLGVVLVIALVVAVDNSTA